MTNVKLVGEGTTGKKGDADYQAFSADYDGYTVDDEGFDLIVEDYGKDKIVNLINSGRSVASVNLERTRLTSGKREAVKTKASAWDELELAETDEERAAILAKHGIG